MEPWLPWKSMGLGDKGKSWDLHACLLPSSAVYSGMTFVGLIFPSCDTRLWTKACSWVLASTNSIRPKQSLAKAQTLASSLTSLSGLSPTVKIKLSSQPPWS